MNTNVQTKLPAIRLLVDGCHGVYVPKCFAESFNMDVWKGMTQNYINCLLAGPDDEQDLYWDYWTSILDNVTLEQDGYVWRLHQDGDLWAVCYELMSLEECINWDYDQLNDNASGELKAMFKEYWTDNGKDSELPKDLAKYAERFPCEYAEADEEFDNE